SELTNAEYVAAFGADLILLNMFDVNRPRIEGSDDDKNVIQRVKDLVGRPVGVNLEPADMQADSLATLDVLPEGRRATRASLQKAKELGVDFVCWTGKPKTGVTNETILRWVRSGEEGGERRCCSSAGKMHGGGVRVDAEDGFVDEYVVEAHIQAGGDVLLLPGVGT